jgi:hypothetical protein
MKNRALRRLLPLVVLSAVGWSLARAAQTSPVRTVPIRMLVSAEAVHGDTPPTIYREDVRVFQSEKRLEVRDWVPLTGDQAALELFVLLDDTSDQSVGLQFDSLREFMNAQPPTTSLGVAYMRHGSAAIVQDLTKDHAQAGKALRLPVGGPVNASPYLSISDLIKKWPKSSARHEIVLISSGLDRLYGGPNDPYLLEAIHRAQRAGVQVYTLRASADGHFAHSFWRLEWGQNNLAQLADETGGEFYNPNIQTVSFKPYLDQLADRLQHQYALTFLATPGKQADYQPIRVETEVPNAELVLADRVYVPLPD